MAGRGSQPDLPGTTKNGGLSNGGRAASTTSIPQPSPTGNNTSSIIKSLGKLKMETTGQLISEWHFDFFLIFQKTNEKFDKFLPQNLKSGQIIK